MSEPTPPGPPPGPPSGPPGPPPLGPPPEWQPPAPSYPEYAAPPPVRSRGRVLLLVGMALVAATAIVVAAAMLPGVIEDLRDPAKSPDLSGRESPVDAVRLYPGLSTEHRDDEPVDYPETPPVGGPHDPEWLACGAYDEPLRDENAVHDLEHGTVWITYSPDLPEADVAALEEQLPDDGIMSPYDNLPAPVVVTVWGAQLSLTGPDDPRLPEFIEEFGDGSTAPEPMASCEGGTNDPQGGPGGVDT